ncbi:hypothetical protein P43SY_005168 [Pythium insidiosum]|uniref:AlNc14C4G614 n=1 Tax=Pythium insidiosum TaxID=114742 RepID=A0AAD5M3J5_PYTIN|nr:hypothetical protein P43SY_005168 [Pythium insidiosum]
MLSSSPLRVCYLAAITALLAFSSSAAEPTPTQDEQLMVRIATHSNLNDATALINKNMVAADNNVVVARSNVVASQNDVIRMEASDMPLLTGEREALAGPSESEGGGAGETAEQHYGYRSRFYYPGFRGGYYGWRYPMSYWNRYGYRYYGSNCPFGRTYGGYYYC